MPRRICGIASDKSRILDRGSRRELIVKSRVAGCGPSVMAGDGEETQLLYIASSIMCYNMVIIALGD